MRRHLALGLLFAAPALVLLPAQENPAAPAAAEADDRPETDSPVGRVVFEDVRRFYRQHTLPPFKDAVAALADAAPEARARGAEYLLALFLQTEADERRDRTPARTGLKLSSGPQDDGAELRWWAAQAFGEATVAGDGREALAPALHLFHEEPRDDSRTWGFQILILIQGPESDAAIADAIRRPDPVGAILEPALREAGRRRLPGIADAVRRLTLHPVPGIRAAAREAAGPLEIPDIPEFTIAGSVGAFLDGRLRDWAAMISAAPPPGASWKRIKVLRPRDDDSFLMEGRLQAETFSGWVASQESGSVRVLDWFGHESTWTEADLEIREDTLAGAAARLIAFREEFDATEDFDRKRALWGEAGIAQSWMSSGTTWRGSLPEALIASWSWHQGDAETAAALIVPHLEKAESENDFFDRIRDLLAVQWDREMLAAFAMDRDYAKALGHARLLAGPRFDGWWHQDRAKGLAAQLPRRAEDFKTLRLPRPDEWKTLAECLDRDERIDFLARRLKLLNSAQGGIPGGIDYGYRQYAVPMGSLPKDWNAWASQEAINPASELFRLDLRGADLLRLVPGLESDDYILAYDLERFGPNDPQTLHRVAWVAGWLVNTCAGEPLLGFAALASSDPAVRRNETAKLRAWCAAHGDQSMGDRLAASVVVEKDWNETKRAFWSLHEVDPSRAAVALRRRVDADPERRRELIRVLCALDRPELAPDARTWVQDPDPVVAFWAGRLLLHHGDRSRREGLVAVIRGLEGQDGGSLVDHVSDDLLAIGDAAARDAVARFLGPAAPSGWRPSIGFLQRLMLAGQEVAFSWLRDALDGNSARAPRLGFFSDPAWEDDAMKPESLLGIIESWKREPGPAEADGQGAGLPERIARTKGWLSSQWRLIREGVPHGIEKMQPPDPCGDFRSISSGWIRRL